ncbi:MAG: phage holin family protein [bacterium]|nr:phage holin family protein [bacterium]
MKRIVKSFLVTAAGVYLTAFFIPGFSYGKTAQDLATITVSLILLNSFVRPIIKIVLLPLNIATFGLLFWLANVIVVYITSLLLPAVRFSSWAFSGYYYHGLIIPAVNFSPLVTLVTAAILIGIISSVLSWLLE